MNILGIIPARGGSKRLKNKHSLKVGDKTILQIAIEESLKSQKLGRLIVSTDDEELARAAREFGAEVPFLRPVELAQDDSKAIDVILHAISIIDCDIVCLLQPTSPFRTAIHIDEAINIFLNHPSAESLMSVSETNFEKSWLKEVDKSGLLQPISPFDPLKVYRGDTNKLYQLNGAIYIIRAADLNKHKSFHTESTLGYIMSREDSVDIDEQLDLDLANTIYKRRSNARG